MLSQPRKNSNQSIERKANDNRVVVVVYIFTCLTLVVTTLHTQVTNPTTLVFKVVQIR